MTIPRVLTVAGSDSGGGAGIQADLKVFTVLSVWGMTALTAVTAQNTVQVDSVFVIPPDEVTRQIDAVERDIGIDALKTGMLPTESHVLAVSRAVARHRLPNLVVDPVAVSKAGVVLTSTPALRAIKRDLLPLATIVTPNIPEAEALTGLRISSLAHMKEAARAIHLMGPHAVLLKGGHLAGASTLSAEPSLGVGLSPGVELSPSAEATDVFYDGREMHTLSSPRILTRNTHGTGCSLSAAIAAFLAKGMSPLDAVTLAKTFITASIEKSLALGSGHGPTNPWAGAACVKGEV